MIAALAIVAALLDGAVRALWPFPQPLGALDRALGFVIIASAWLVAVGALNEVRIVLGARSIAMQRAVGVLFGAGGGAVLGAFAAQGGMLRRLAPQAVYVAAGACVGALVVAGAMRLWHARGQSRAAAFVVGGAALVLLAIDRVVLVRRYGWLHTAALVVALIGLACAVGSDRSRAARASGLVAVVALLASLAILPTHPIVRALVGEHSRLAARLLPLVPIAAPAATPTQTTFSPRRDPARRLTPVRDRLDETPTSIVVLSVDAWRRDAFSPTLTPHLWQRAQHGTCFARAYTPTPHTSLALASLHTGRDVGPRTERAPLASDTPLLAERFRSVGWKTAAFYPPAVFTIEPERIATLAARQFGFEYVKQQFSSAAARTHEVMAYLDEVAPTRALLWVHYFEPHEPYEDHGDPTATTARARYEREVATVDREAEDLLRRLSSDRQRRVFVVLTADHGEEFGEHDGRYHGTTLYEEQLGVPLCLFELGELGVDRPARLDRAPVSLVDVMPTLLGWIGVPNALDGDGLPLALDRDNDLGPAFATLGAETAVIDAQWKWIVSRAAGGQQLFDLVADPNERENRVAQEAATVARLQAALLGYSERGEGNAKTERLLQRVALGDRDARAQLLEELPTFDPELAARGAEALVAQRGRTDVPALDRATIAATRRQLPDGVAARWLDVLTTSGPPSPSWLAAECAHGNARLCAEASLAANDIPRVGESVLDRSLPEGLRGRLLTALGGSGDPAALDPLLIAMADVRIRRAAVRALDRLADYRAIGYVARWAPHEPYVDARLAMVELLQHAALRDPSGAARAGLAAVAAREHEASIRAQLGLPAATESTIHDK